MATMMASSSRSFAKGQMILLRMSSSSLSLSSSTTTTMYPNTNCCTQQHRQYHHHQKQQHRHRDYSTTTPTSFPKKTTTKVIAKDEDDVTGVVESNGSPTTPPSSSSSSPFLENHQLNINFGVIKSYETYSLKTLCDEPTTALQGIGPLLSKSLSTLGLNCIKDMANYKYYHVACMIQTLSTIEEITKKAEGEEEEGVTTTGTTISGNRLPNTLMNINKAIDKDYEHVTLNEMLQLPISALQGISKTNEEKLHALDQLGIKTIQDLAHSKYFHWSHAIFTGAKYEE